MPIFSPTHLHALPAVACLTRKRAEKRGAWLTPVRDILRSYAMCCAARAAGLALARGVTRWLVGGGGVVVGSASASLNACNAYLYQPYRQSRRFSSISLSSL